MPELTIKLTLDEANVILASLGNLPYIQVHSLIHNLQNQVAPQLADMEKKSIIRANGKEHKMTV
ncbi:MAG: hypothetical protein E6H09_18570 [Bacteroidetes bacterium]|jgi:hypothetical protein|nr:MAG: hypothetical protein E6H09_18570 [Bacteroidota bacterium]